MKEALPYDKACDAAKLTEGFQLSTRVMVVFHIVIAWMLMILVPYVLEALGFA